MEALSTIVVVTFLMGSITGALVTCVALLSRRPVAMTILAVVVTGASWSFSYQGVLMLFHKMVFG